MNIEEALEKLIENAQNELHYRHRQDKEKANRAGRGHDENKLRDSAAQVDRYAHHVLQLHETQLPSR